MSSVSRATCQRVYEAIRVYVDDNGHPPSLREIAAAVDKSLPHTRRAVVWLNAYRFLTYTPSLQRTIRLTPRMCSCGVEITPVNAVITVNGHRKLFVRGVCEPCWKVQITAIDRQRYYANRDYYLRTRKRNLKLQKEGKPQWAA